jgi:hypothetical protein
MAKIKDVRVKCPYCGTESPSPIFIGDSESFDSAVTQGNTVQCRNAACRKMFPCNKENMTYRLAEGGGFVGDEFGEK